MAETSTAPSTPAAQAAANRLAGLRPPPAAAPQAPGGPAAAAPETVLVQPAKRRLFARKPKLDENGQPVKRKKPIKPIIAVVLVLAVGYVVKGKVVKPHYDAAHPAPLGTIYDFPNSVTTNLPDGSLAQIGISIQLTKVASTKTVTADTSELTGTAVATIGAESYSTLLSTPGRAALRATLLHEFQAELGPADGVPQVTAVYFTSFVLQQQ